MSTEGITSGRDSKGRSEGLYEKNLTVLAARFPGLIARMGSSDVVPADTGAVAAEIETVETRDGEISIRYGGSWLHSRHAPLREAARLIESSIPDNCPFCLFYGFGLGYQIEEFVRRHPATPFAVVIPDARLFRESLKLRDYTALFMSREIALALESQAEAMPALLENRPVKDMQICMLRPVVELYKEYFSGCEKVIRDYLSRKQINAATLDKFSRLWVSNICANLPLSAEVPGVYRLKDHFKGMPALLLAAGPTLEETLPLIDELRKRTLVVAVDTALKACLREGIEPDILVLTDPQYWNSRHLDRCRTGRTILVSDVSTNPPPLRGYEGRTFFCSTPFPLGQFFESRTEIKGKLKSGGSVATAAWDLVRHCGCSRVYCAGLDLGFPDGETHYRGSTFEQRVHMYSYRTNPAENGSWLTLMGGNPFPAEDREGRKLLSDQRMKIYIRWFEEQIAIHKEFPTTHLSSRGIRLEGSDWCSAEDLLELPECRQDIENHLNAAMEYKPGTDKPALINARDALLNELDELMTLTLRGEELCTLMLNENILPEGLEELDAIDGAILNRESREMAGFILAPVLEEKMAEPAASDPAEILERSRSLYADLYRNLDFHRMQINRIDFS